MMKKCEYTGPKMLIGDYDQIELSKGLLVKAEVNINIATVYEIYSVSGTIVLNDAKVDIAAKYLKPVKPKGIHFDLKGDEPERKPFNFSKPLVEFLENIVKRQFSAEKESDNTASVFRVRDCLNTFRGNEKAGEAVVSFFDELDKIITNEPFDSEGFFKELLENKGKFPFISGYYPLTEDGKDIDMDKFFNMEEFIKIFNKYKHSKADDSHEVGGNHYKMAIEPWDYIHIVQELTDTYKAKNHDYGNSFADLFSECGMPYAYGHLKEKLNRIKSLMSKEAEVKSENMVDSLMDLANYAILTIMELRKEGKC